MNGRIPESDWQQFKRVHGVLLERFCQRVLAELDELLRSGDGSAHERYLRIYKLIEARDKALDDVFSDFRRSTAVMQLALMRRVGLLEDEDLGKFTEETQEIIRRVNSFRND